ncbi:MAG: RluA family pseudouridine synthase [Gemmataceae bacterium]|nr:RluA family pseudouridine synthase [Gemmataceae bacterium]
MPAADLPELDVLFEDNHCLAVAKPSGVPSAHFDGGAATLDLAAKAYLKSRYNKPGEVFLGIVHRLDKPTSGVLLFARTSKAAARLSEQFRSGAIDKTYWAIAEGEIRPAAGTWDDHLRKDPATALVRVVDPSAEGAKAARTHYSTLGFADGMSWLELRPQTGRTHQLRVQLATRGHPIVGDYQYGSEIVFPGGAALHARSLTFLHPIRAEPITLTAPLPRRWRGRFPSFFRDLPS